MDVAESSAYKILGRRSKWFVFVAIQSRVLIIFSHCLGILYIQSLYLLSG